MSPFDKPFYARGDDEMDDFGDPSSIGESGEEYDEEAEEEEEVGEPSSAIGGAMGERLSVGGVGGGQDLAARGGGGGRWPHVGWARKRAIAQPYRRGRAK